jgi:hypothetical protein
MTEICVVQRGDITIVGQTKNAREFGQKICSEQTTWETK